MTGPSFRFRLERLRSLREHTEDLAKQELAAALTMRTQSEQELASTDAQVGSALDAQRGAASLLLSSNDLVSSQAYLERVERRRAAVAHDLRGHDQNVDRRRTVVEKAMRDRKALDRLKERRRADHAAHNARLESAVLDEIAGNLFRRSGVR